MQFAKDAVTNSGFASVEALITSALDAFKPSTMLIQLTRLFLSSISSLEQTRLCGRLGDDPSVTPLRLWEKVEAPYQGLHPSSAPPLPPLLPPAPSFPLDRRRTIAYTSYPAGLWSLP